MKIKILTAVLAAVFIPSVLSGCSGKKETTTTTLRTVEGVPPDRHVYVGSDGVVYSRDREVSATTTKTKTVEVEKDDPDRGLFGIIGNIIALPFRAVGALFSVIF
jgi:hypothetical protein